MPPLPGPIVDALLIQKVFFVRRRTIVLLYARNPDLSKSHWNPKRKLEGNHAFFRHS